MLGSISRTAHRARVGGMLRLSLAAGFHILACTATPRGARTFASAAAAGGATHSVTATTVSSPNGHKDVEAYVFTPSVEKHTATMILTHGLGDTALGWTDAVQYFYAPALPHFKFVLPVRAATTYERAQREDMWLTTRARMHRRHRTSK